MTRKQRRDRQQVYGEEVATRSHACLLFVHAWKTGASDISDLWATSAGFPNPGQRCILFTSSKNRAQHQDALAVWSGLAADDEKEVIYAMVDLDSNKKAGCWAPARGCLPEGPSSEPTDMSLQPSVQVAQRFKDVQVPSAVLLRNRAVGPPCHV